MAVPISKPHDAATFLAYDARNVGQAPRVEAPWFPAVLEGAASMIAHGDIDSVVILEWMDEHGQYEEAGTLTFKEA